jgi:hypothetical protein
MRLETGAGPGARCDPRPARPRSDRCVEGLRDRITAAIVVLGSWPTTVCRVSFISVVTVALGLGRGEYI